jgi:hypothetical protein
MENRKRQEEKTAGMHELNGLIEYRACMPGEA